MRIKVYDYLAEDAKQIREKVFMQEQEFQNEFDEIDSVAVQIVMYDETETPVATCRIFEDTEKGMYIFGRLAVGQEYRGRNIGSKMIEAAEQAVLKKGGKAMKLHAQCRVKNFYEKSEYQAYGEIDEDEGCPHIWMRKSCK